MKFMKRNEIKRERTIEEVVRVEYIAEDGQIFYNEEECKKYGFYYFNTFNDREKVFNDIIKLIEIEQEK